MKKGILYLILLLNRVDTELDSIYSNDEAFSGKHAIKISRLMANETDKLGEGIESDFIRVIPGNYQFTLFIKLLNISGNRERLGTKIFDAVNIRFLYFDKNKIQIEGKHFYPQQGIYIDNSFKGYSFSNYWKIDSVDWIKVIGKSHNFPFPDGDILDEAKYIKIFLGLKGTGTMWIDSLNFRYTESNLTSLEKTLPFVDSTVEIHDILIPTPKQVSKLESIIYFKNENQNDLPLIVIPPNSSKEIKSAAALLQEKIESVYLNKTRNKINISKNIVTYIPEKTIHSNRLIFSIGKTGLYNKYKDKIISGDLVKHPQAYIIDTYYDLPNVVFLAGRSEIGNYFAACTAIQLFDNKSFIFHNAKISDYPDIAERDFVLSADIYKDFNSYNSNILHELSRYKFSGIYLPFEFRTQNYKNSMSQYNKLKYICNSTGVFKNYILLQQDSMCCISNCISDNEINSVKKNNSENCNIFPVSYLNSCNFAGIAYMSKDYFLPENFTGECNISTEHLPVDPGKDLIMLKKLQNRYKNSIHNVDIEFLPPWYNNELIDYGQGKGESYFNNLNRYSKSYIKIFWTGTSFYSWEIDEADYLRFRQLIDDIPVLWDNSLLIRNSRCNYGGYIPFYRDRIRLSSLIEPYWNEYCEEITFDLSKIVFNYPPENELDIIRLCTALEFAWNSSDYNPDLTLVKVLTLRYGPSATKEILFFNDNYFKFYQIILKLKTEGISHKNIKKGELFIEELKLNFINLQYLLGKDNKLINELDLILRQVISEYNNTIISFNTG